MKMPEGGIDFTNRESIMKFMGGFNNVVQFAEVGEGTLPVAACIEAAWPAAVSISWSSRTTPTAATRLRA